MTWERFRQLFEEEYYPNCRPGTRLVFDNAFNLFEKVCNPRTLRGINERTVSAFAAGLRKLPGNSGNTMAASSIHTRLQFLHIALAWAEDQKLIPECPKFPSVKVPKTKPLPVPAESFERLMAKAPDQQTRVFLLCGWLAGLRRKEAMELEWVESTDAPWVDFARDRIILPAVFTKAVEDQWVPLDPELRKALEALPRHGRKVFRFVRSDGQPVTLDAVSLRVKRLAHQAGVKLTIKTLRKGFGCRYAGKVPAQVLQKLMRHSNIAITMDYYANVDDAVEAAVLGRQRNSSCNSAATDSATPAGPTDANPAGDGGSVT